MSNVKEYYDDKYKTLVIEKHYSIYNIDVFNLLKERTFPSIPKIYEIEEKEDELIVKEECINADNLEIINLNEEKIVDILIKLCDILIPIHKAGIVHRDIKPSNVLYDNGNVTLIDFNASKIINPNENRDTVLLGTNGFAAPEQYGFGASNEKTDIYALGALASYLFKNKSPSFAIKDIINKCMMINPDDRYFDVKELKEALIKHKSRNRLMNYPSNKYTPVGFRERKTSHIIVAIIGYLLILFFSSCLQVKDNEPSNYSLLEYRIMFVVSCVATIFFNHNYLGIQDKLHIKRNKNKLVYIIKLAIIDYVIIFMVVLFLVLIFSII